MPSSDAQQCDRGPLRMPPTLLPVAEGVDADAHRASELRLGKPDKTAQGGNILTGIELPEDEAPVDAGGNGASELLVGQFRNFEVVVGHHLSSLEER